MMTKYGNSNPQQELTQLRTQLNGMKTDNPSYASIVNHIQLLENQLTTLDNDSEDR